ncbi:MAG TPA: PQQ-dependent sugar dehydrogenase [Hanamia sp.]|nr:PQQ-dependent sugar dehydrogenase [Hanamia sp.]
MTTKLLTILTGFSFLISSCNSTPRADGQENPSGSDTTQSPVETKAPNSDYKPAFAGQTRVAGVKTTSNFRVQVLSDKLDRPWGITTLPDGRFLITEKDGDMRIASADGTLSEKIKGIPAVNNAGQGGLLGITIDPDFSANRMVYWTFSQSNPDGNLTAVAKGKLSEDEKSIENAQVIYRATPAHKSALHYGGRILFDKTGNIIFSTGERSDLETRPQAQFLNSSLGKVIRITTDGKAAPGNPFENRSDARPELYSYGHRNVQGLALNPATGDLWESEFGPRGGDEINLIKPGNNYGWPTITYGIEYAGPKIGDGIQQKEGMEQPVYYYDPVISPSGITFCSSDAIPEWKNNLFVSALSGTHIARLVIKNDKVVGEERLLEKESQRFRDITQGKDGALYAITDQGRLYRIGK